MNQGIGNLVPDTVPVSDNEDANAIERLSDLDKIVAADLVKEYKVWTGPKTQNPETILEE